MPKVSHRVSQALAAVAIAIVTGVAAPADAQPKVKLEPPLLGGEGMPWNDFETYLRVTDAANKYLRKPCLTPADRQWILDWVKNEIEWLIRYSKSFARTKTAELEANDYAGFLSKKLIQLQNKPLCPGTGNSAPPPGGGTTQPPGTSGGGSGGTATGGGTGVTPPSDSSTCVTQEMIDQAQKDWNAANGTIDTLDALINDARGELAGPQKVLDAYEKKKDGLSPTNPTTEELNLLHDVDDARAELGRLKDKINNLEQARRKAVEAREAAANKLQKYGVEPKCEEPKPDDGLMMAPGGQSGQFAGVNRPDFNNVSNDAFDVDLADSLVTDAVNVSNTCCEPLVQKIALQIVGGKVIVPKVKPKMASAPRLFPLLGEWIASLRDMWVAPLSASVAPGDSLPIQTVITSLGTSQGEALQLQIVNDGPVPIRLSSEGLILEPIKRTARNQVQKALEKIESKLAEATSVKVEGYCVNYALQPPDRGMLFRIAAPDVQARYADASRILRTVETLNQGGWLTPDSNPKLYVESIKQYALWAKLEGWDEQKYTNTWIEITRKQRVAQQQPWTSAMESTLRRAAPRRWRDIRSALRIAELPRSAVSW